MGDFYWEQNCKLLLLLMNNKVTGVSFSKLPQMSKEAMKCVTDTCFAMTTLCPKLQKFVCTEEIRRSKIEKNKGLLLFFGLSLQFAELQVLKMCNLECDNLRLGLLAENLPKLR